MSKSISPVLAGVVSILSWGPVTAQDPMCPGGVLACTADNAPGSTGYDDSVTDLAYDPISRQVWAIEGPLPNHNGLRNSRATVFNEDLKTGLRTVNLKFTEAAFGIAEIPSRMSFAGSFYILSPGTLDLNGYYNLAPKIGMMDPDGGLIAPGGAFTAVVNPVTGKAPQGFFTAIDVHPSEDEMVILDSGGDLSPPSFLFLDRQYRVLRGPFLLEGDMNYFGGGITYTSDTTILVTGQFSHTFETKLVLEYDIHSGQYTGRTAVLDHPDGINASTLLAVGIDDGLLGTTPVLFTYDVSKDSIYAIAYDLRPAAAPVRGIAPACDVQADGRVRLAWTNSPDMAYDTIRIRLNGSIVETLPGGATEYTTPQPVAGKFLFCVETLTSPEENVVQACCEGEDLRTPAFLPAGDSGVSRFHVDPTGKHFQTGIASPPVVETKEDFRLHVVGSYDNTVRVTDYKRVKQPVDLATSPAIRSMLSGNYIVNFAATGIALMDIPVGGATIPMYMIYDNDGPTGNSVSSASLHFLRDTVLPEGTTVTPAGSLYREEITAIDFSAIDAEGIEIIGWDTDPAGDLIAVERQRGRLLKLHYDPLVHTLKATAEAPLPIKDLTPFTNANFPLGGITVLPSGFYLLAGGDVFDTTITRVFLLTPMGPGPQASVQLVGAENGLRTLGLITGYGRMVGPPASYGLESGFIRGEGQGAGVLFLNTLHYFPTPGTGFQGNLLVEMDCPLAHPDLVAEALVDQSSTAGAPGSVESGDLQPAFGTQVQTTDYHYQILNPSKDSSLRIRVRVILDGEEVLDFLDRDVTIPPGRRLYRVARNRPEKAFNVRVENLGQASQIVRILAGATALKSAAPVEHFRRGDVDGSTRVELNDVIYLLTWLYLSGPEPLCPDAADSDDNGILALTDAIYSLTWLFLSGIPMPSPGPTACGPDTKEKEDSLGPCSSSGCP